MPGAPKLVRIVDDKTYENLTIHTTADKEKAASKAVADWESGYADELKKLLHSIQTQYPGEKILLVAAKAGVKSKVLELLHAEKIDNVEIQHFGNLKGSNAYRDCHHIVFANIPRWGTESYLLRAIWLEEDPNQVLKQTWRAGSRVKDRSVNLTVTGFPFADSGLEKLRLQYDTPDMIQTIMRTKLRERGNLDPVHVWLPGTNIARTGMLLDYFVGVMVVTQNDRGPR